LNVYQDSTFNKIEIYKGHENRRSRRGEQQVNATFFCILHLVIKKKGEKINFQEKKRMMNGMEGKERK